MSRKSFADLGISAAVRDQLERGGIHTPFAIQELVIADALGGHDLLVSSPTGSGKTLAFAAPIADRIEKHEPAPAALILAPTRELALQILDEVSPLARSRGLTAAAAYGGVGIAQQIKRAPRSHILVATPGRLLDLMDRGAVDLGRIRILVLDEADRMLDMGFRPAIGRIVGATPRGRQTFLFSATLDGEVAKIASSYTHEPKRHSHDPPGTRPDVEHRFVAMPRDDKLGVLVSELRADRGLALVFVRTKRGADRLVKRLSRHGVDSVALHGDKSQRQRERALARFDSGRVDALVATDVAARGLDVTGISHVFNFDPPADSDTYLHRVGRTARAGRSGVGLTFVTPDENADVGAIARKLELAYAFDGMSRPRRREKASANATTGRRSAQMPTGRVKWYSNQKGFGFISPDEHGGADLFVHQTAIAGDGSVSLQEGATVTFETEASDKGPRAVDVRPQ
jgi:superfamily II DNA/RNA helicase